MEKRGINLFFHKHFGITNKRFRDFLERTNLLKNRELFWITFQGYVHIQKKIKTNYKKI